MDDFKVILVGGPLCGMPYPWQSGATALYIYDRGYYLRYELEFGAETALFEGWK